MSRRITSVVARNSFLLFYFNSSYFSPVLLRVLYVTSVLLLNRIGNFYNAATCGSQNSRATENTLYPLFRWDEMGRDASSIPVLIFPFFDSPYTDENISRHSDPSEFYNVLVIFLSYTNLLPIISYPFFSSYPVFSFLLSFCMKCGKRTGATCIWVFEELA